MYYFLVVFFFIKLNPGYDDIASNALKLGEADDHVRISTKNVNLIKLLKKFSNLA